MDLGKDENGDQRWIQGCRVPPGRYRVEVVHEGKVVFSRVVAVVEGGTATVDFPVPGR